MYSLHYYYILLSEAFSFYYPLKIIFLLHLTTFHTFDNTKPQNHWNAHLLAFRSLLVGHVLYTTDCLKSSSFPFLFSCFFILLSLAVGKRDCLLIALFSWEVLHYVSCQGQKEYTLYREPAIFLLFFLVRPMF